MKIKRKTSIKNIIPVSSMSDIAFLLLIFLMLSSIVNMKKGPQISLPKAKELSKPKKALKYDLSIDKNGNIFFEGTYINTEKLSLIFSERILSSPNLFVQINADEDTHYEKVDAVIKALQAAKSYKIIFVCKKLEKE